MAAMVVVPTMSNNLISAAADGVFGKGALAFLEVVEETAAYVA